MASTPARNIHRNLKLEADAAKVLRGKLQGIIAEDDAEAIRDAIEGETDLFEGIDHALARIAELCAMQEAIKTQETRLKARKARLEAQENNIREAILQAMVGAGLDGEKLERPTATLTVSAKPRELEIITETDVPPRFWTEPEPKIDKRALLAALRAGEDIEGAKMDNGGVQLSIRTA